ncbi:CsbD family protein [Streptomyces sp. URMC 127]|uniref:CsbD family protein n=1 Tax=Streptomyces sp. URMC 127 TaxID=3423402 RepID=UPI003F1B52E1
MTIMGKATDKAKQVKGAVKETAGRLTGNPKREAQGHIEKLEAKARESVAKVRKHRRKHGE